MVTVLGRGVPIITFNEEPGQITLGTAVNKVVSQGGSGRLVVTITNLGNEAVDASGLPVKIVDVLPEGGSPRR